MTRSGTGKWTTGAGTCTDGTATGTNGGTATGTGTTGASGAGTAGAAGAGTIGAAGAGTAGTAAATGGFRGLGAATAVGRLRLGLGADASTGADGGACQVGTMRCWPGVGCNATVERMPIASAISSASTALIPATANPVPISRSGLRRGWLSSGAKSLSMTAVAASASSSGTAL
jgi:hypothetical protein